MDATKSEKRAPPPVRPKPSSFSREGRPSVAPKPKLKPKMCQMAPGYGGSTPPPLPRSAPCGVPPDTSAHGPDSGGSYSTSPMLSASPSFSNQNEPTLEAKQELQITSGTHVPTGSQRISPKTSPRPKPRPRPTPKKRGSIDKSRQLPGSTDLVSVEINDNDFSVPAVISTSASYDDLDLDCNMNCEKDEVVLSVDDNSNKRLPSLSQSQSENALDDVALNELSSDNCTSADSLDDIDSKSESQSLDSSFHSPVKPPRTRKQRRSIKMDDSLSIEMTDSVTSDTPVSSRTTDSCNAPPLTDTDVKSVDSRTEANVPTNQTGSGDESNVSRIAANISNLVSIGLKAQLSTKERPRPPPKPMARVNPPLSKQVAVDGERQSIRSPAAKQYGRSRSYEAALDDPLDASHSQDMTQSLTAEKSICDISDSNMNTPSTVSSRVGVHVLPVPVSPAPRSQSHGQLSQELKTQHVNKKPVPRTKPRSRTVGNLTELQVPNKTSGHTRRISSGSLGSNSSDDNKPIPTRVAPPPPPPKSARKKTLEVSVSKAQSHSGTDSTGEPESPSMPTCQAPAPPPLLKKRGDSVKSKDVDRSSSSGDESKRKSSVPTRHAPPPPPLPSKKRTSSTSSGHEPPSPAPKLLPRAPSDAQAKPSGVKNKKLPPLPINRGDSLDDVVPPSNIVDNDESNYDPQGYLLPVTLNPAHESDEAEDDDDDDYSYADPQQLEMTPKKPRATSDTAILFANYNRELPPRPLTDVFGDDRVVEGDEDSKCERKTKVNRQDSQKGERTSRSSISSFGSHLYEMIKGKRSSTSSKDSEIESEVGKIEATRSTFYLDVDPNLADIDVAISPPDEEHPLLDKDVVIVTEDISNLDAGTGPVSLDESVPAPVAPPRQRNKSRVNKKYSTEVVESAKPEPVNHSVDVYYSTADGSLDDVVPLAPSNRSSTSSSDSDDYIYPEAQKSFDSQEELDQIISAEDATHSSDNAHPPPVPPRNRTPGDGESLASPDGDGDVMVTDENEYSEPAELDADIKAGDDDDENAEDKDENEYTDLDPVEELVKPPKAESETDYEVPELLKHQDAEGDRDNGVNIQDVVETTSSTDPPELPPRMLDSSTTIEAPVLPPRVQKSSSPPELPERERKPTPPGLPERERKPSPSPPDQEEHSLNPPELPVRMYRSPTLPRRNPDMKPEATDAPVVPPKEQLIPPQEPELNQVGCRQSSSYTICDEIVKLRMKPVPRLNEASKTSSELSGDRPESIGSSDTGSDYIDMQKSLTTDSLYINDDLPRDISVSTLASDDSDDDAIQDGTDNSPTPVLPTRKGTVAEDKLAKKRRKAFFIAQEIMTSEQTFVDVLRLLHVDLPVAINQASFDLHEEVIPKQVFSSIFKYLPQLYAFNDDLLADLISRIKDWDNVPRLADIFVKKGPFLRLYTSYIRQFEDMSTAFDDARRKYVDFDRALRDFEQSPRCANLLLKHYLLKPVQRIPQYRLLLEDYLHQLPEDSTEYRDTKVALEIVSDVAEEANQSMKFGVNTKKLWDIQNSLIGNFEVIKPGREFIKEGILMKLSRKEMQPRMFFLLSDVLLCTTPLASGNFKLNNVISLPGMKVRLPKKEDFQNEFSIISTQKSFTISANTMEERDEWLQIIRDTVGVFMKKRHSFDARNSNMSVLNISLDAESDNYKLGHRAPVWVPDARVSMCMLCTEKFTRTFRKHHCRACGKAVCGNCSDCEAPLHYLKYKPARVCVECFNILEKDFDENSVEPVEAEDKPKSFLSRAAIKAKFRGIPIAGSSLRKSKKRELFRPTVLKEVQANDESADMSGYLKVWKGNKWKKRWFVLKGKVLYTYKASEDAAAIDSQVLLGYEIRTFNTYFEQVEPNLVFELTHKGTTPRTFRTESSMSRDKWVTAIQSATIP